MFGRGKKDEEDPFAALREGGVRDAARATAHVSDESSKSATSSFGDDDGDDRPGSGLSGIPGVRTRKRHPVADRLLVTLLILGSLGASAALLVRAERDAPEAGSAAVDTPGADADEPGSGSPGDAGDDPAPPPPRRYDLVRPGGFQRALARVGATTRRGEVVALLRVAPDRINAFVTSPRTQRQRMITVADDLAVDVSTGGTRSGPGLRIAEIPVGAPSRALRSAARKGGFPAQRLDYLVLSVPSLRDSSPTWSLFFRGVAPRNTHWIATLGGRVVYRPGEQPTQSAGAPGSSQPGSSSTLTVTRNGERTQFTGAEAQRISDCIRRNAGDGAAIQRCLP